MAANCDLKTSVGPERARVREAMIARKKDLTTKVNAEKKKVIY